MATMPLRRSMPLTLPNVRMMRPDLARSTLAFQTDSLSSASIGLSPLTVLDREKVLHDVVQAAVPVLRAEGVVELPVKRVELEVDLVARGVRLEGRPLDPAHGGLGLGERGVAIALAAGGDGSGHGRAEGARLGRAGDLHLEAGDVGVDLHD